MADSYGIFEGVGDSRVDHVAIQVVHGKMGVASAILIGLGFIEDHARHQVGDWGEAYFFGRPGSITIQLTDSNDSRDIPPSESHVAIVVDDPLLVANSLEKWAETEPRNLWVEREYSGKNVFMTIPRVFTISFELVPHT